MAEEPRIPLVVRDRATDEQRCVGDFIYGKRNEPYGGPSAIMLHAPELANRFEAIREHILAAGLPEDLLHLATLVLARHWSVDYVWNVRVGLALKAGIDPTVIEAIRTHQRPQRLSEAQAAIYDYVSELLGPVGVSDSTFQRAREVLHDDKAIVELTAVVGVYTMLALQCRAADLPAQPGTSTLPR